MMNVSIRQLPAFYVAYLRHTGAYAGGGIPATWDQLNLWSQAQGFGNPRHTMIGISWDNPRTTTAEKCRYDACVEIAPDYPVSAPLAVQTIPGGAYACARFQSNAQEIGQAWEWLCTLWIAQSGYQFDTRPCFELYPADINCMPEPGVFICDLCIPVQPAG